MAWVERRLNEGIKVFRVFSDTPFWPPDPLLDRVPKHRAVDTSGLHPSAQHIRTVRETIERVFAPSGAILEYVILVTQFESRGPLYRRFPETEQYVLEVVDAFQDLSNLLLELGNEVEAHGKGWGAPRVNRMLRRVKNRWPYVMMSCSSGRAPDDAGYSNYIYPTASWANIHYPRRDFPELSFGWPTFSGPIVPVADDEPEFYPRTTIAAYVRHFELIQEQNGFMTYTPSLDSSPIRTTIRISRCCAPSCKRGAGDFPLSSSYPVKLWGFPTLFLRANPPTRHHREAPLPGLPSDDCL